MPNHISCDGFQAGALDLKVFAWDGGNAGWAFEDAGNGVQLKSFQNSNLLIKPEIAMVTDGANIFAIIVYNAANGMGLTNAYMEVLKYDGFNSWTNILYQIIPGSMAASVRTINVAGDKYGHFIIVWDEGSLNHTSTAIGQLTGIIDASGLNVTLGTQGIITRNNYDMSEPDADVSIAAGAINVTNFNKVYLTFVTKQGFSITTAAIPFNDLFNGGTHDIISSNTVLTEIGHACSVSHPSVSVDDGFTAFVNSNLPHAAVVYQEACTQPDYQSINLFGVTPKTKIANVTLLNSPVITGAINENSTVVTGPINSLSVAAWDFATSSSATLLDALAHTASYDAYNNSFDAGYSFDMQILTAPFINTRLITASGLSQLKLLYFYLDWSLGGTLQYKERSYTDISLRSIGNELSSELTIYPNPVSLFINIHTSAEISSGLITDVTGKQVFVMQGNLAELINAINKNLSTFNSGLYFVKLNAEDGRMITTKFIKE